PSGQVGNPAELLGQVVCRGLARFSEQREKRCRGGGAVPESGGKVDRLTMSSAQAAGLPELQSVLAALNIVLLERQPNGELILRGNPPAWLSDFAAGSNYDFVA